MLSLQFYTARRSRLAAVQAPESVPYSVTGPQFEAGYGCSSRRTHFGAEPNPQTRQPGQRTSPPVSCPKSKGDRSGEPEIETTYPVVRAQFRPETGKLQGDFPRGVTAFFSTAPPGIEIAGCLVRPPEQTVNRILPVVSYPNTGFARFSRRANTARRGSKSPAVSSENRLKPVGASNLLT